MKVIVWVVIIIVLILIIGIIGFRYLHAKMHNADIPETVIDQQYRGMTVMTFFPHPDDEITVLGTLLAMKKQGARIILVCLTRGEAGPTGGLVDQGGLGALRTTEMQKVANLINADQLEILDLPDGGVQEQMDALHMVARNMVAKYQPELVLTYDNHVGFYGHPDHVAASQAMLALYNANKESAGFPVKQLWQVTLCPNQINIALQISPTFKKRYPQDGSQGLPPADFYYDGQPTFHLVKEAMGLHASQAQVFTNLLPYHDKVPHFIYSRLFGREYFYQVP